jgi:beta-galactosidase
MKRFGRGLRIVICVFAFLLAAVPCKTVLAQTPAPRKPTFHPDQMDTILYGAAYYPEYMPYERTDTDIALMKKAGINVVRIGESTWGLWEPEDGRFEYAWMDPVIEKLYAAGIRVILGTPTYSIPPWMYKKHPEMVVTRLGGQYLYYGLRQNTDLMNQQYRFYCERVIRKILEHYKDNPAVIGYQIDNETSSAGAANPDVQEGFKKYLISKYQTTDQLNKLWGLNYWGQRLHNWDELPPRDGILNPGWKLDWERYAGWQTADFLAWQAKLVNEYKRPDQFVTHDLAGAPRPVVDELAITRALDIAAVNPYHGTQDDFDGESSSYEGDYSRSLKETNYLVTETNAEAIGWDSKYQYPPYDNQLRQDVYTHISSGANMVEYWHWHSLHYGQETYWKGVLGHDLQPGRTYEEVSRTAHELQRIGPEIADLHIKNDVAILYSRDSYYGIEFMKFSDRVDYSSILHQMYKALYHSNIGVDFVFPESTSLSGYKVIVVPPLYIASDELLIRLSDYVKNGGHLVLAFKSGFCNEYSTVRWEMMPGPLGVAAGFHYQEFSSLKQPLPLKDDPYHLGAENKVSDWAEMIIPDAAKPLAYYEHPFLGKYPALTRNQFGKGSLTYEGTVLNDQLQKAVLLDVLKTAGLVTSDQSLPSAIHVKHARNRMGKTLHFYFNYSNDARMVPYAYPTGTDLLTQGPILRDQSIQLQPWDVAIVEER